MGQITVLLREQKGSLKQWLFFVRYVYLNSNTPLLKSVFLTLTV